MKVKDALDILDKKKSVLSDLQNLEKNLRDDEDFNRLVSEKAGISDAYRAICFARSSYYDHEILPLRKKIEEAVIDIHLEE